MRRRALLSALAGVSAGLAGCPGTGSQPDTVTPAPVPSTGSSNDGTVSTERPTDDPGDRSTDGETDDGSRPPDERTSVIELATVPRTYAFRPTTMHTDDGARVALWFEATATADHPARLRGWLENANDFANTFRIEWIPAVGRTHSQQPDGYDHEARLHVAPTADNAIATAVPDVARTDDGLWYVEDVGPWMPSTHELAAGERVELEYHLVGEPDTPGRPTGTYEFRGDDETTAAVSVWNTDSPGPDAASRFDGRSVPGFDDPSSMQWYHDADESTTAFVRPSRERAELDGRVDFEMVNHSHETLRCGHWNLYKLVDREWFHLGPRVHTADCRGLAPGGRLQWSLRAFNADSVSCTEANCGRGLTRGYLGGGTYAVVAGYGHGPDESAALVELVGEPVSIVPTEGASRERQGATVVVTTEHYGDDEAPADDRFTLMRTNAADERLLAEQVMAAGRFASGGIGLRNALAAFDTDAERVVVRADENVVDQALGYDSSTRTFSFRGRAYVARRDGKRT